jgi:hypothetical protein
MVKLFERFRCLTSSVVNCIPDRQALALTDAVVVVLVNVAGQSEIPDFYLYNQNENGTSLNDVINMLLIPYNLYCHV